MKRTISLILLAALLTACGESAASADTAVPSDTAADVETAAGETLSFADAHAAAKDDLPKADFGGEDFYITINNYVGCEAGFLAEESNGDVLNDAVFARNSAVEERFNVKLNYISDSYSSLKSKVSQSVTAGEDYYQLLCQHTIEANPWVTGGYLYNWHDIPHVDFDKPWWSPSNSSELTHDGKNFLAVGDFALTTIGRTYAVYYDKVEAEAYKLPDINALVYDGEWTIDALHSYSKDIYRDLNANGKRDSVEDFYGLTTSTAANVSAFLWSSGEKIIENGEIVLNVEKVTDILEKLLTICYSTDGTCYDLNYVSPQGHNKNYIGAEKMASGTTLFALTIIEAGITFLRDSEHDYGIIPYPKWDAAQKDYHTIVDGGFTSMAIPKTVTDTERVGIIAEALCAETYRTVVPDYYEIALKQKGTRDEASIEMIDFVMSTRIYDFGYIYDGWQGFGFLLERRVKNDDGGFASYYAANIDSVQAHYDSIFNVFENYGE